MRTRQWVLAAILLLLGMYFLDNLVSGRIYFYINMNFGWLTWLGTGVLLMLGATNAYDLLREARAEGNPAREPNEYHPHEHNGDHDHSHAPSWPKLALIAVPLILVALFPPMP